MICQKCKRDFPEREIQESHDVPCYLFIYEKGRNNKKNQADKLGRHWLCQECHQDYEKKLNNRLILEAIQFSGGYFNG